MVWAFCSLDLRMKFEILLFNIVFFCVLTVLEADHTHISE